MMTELASLKEERKAEVLSDGSMVMGTVVLEEAVLVFGLPGLRRMMEMWL